MNIVVLREICGWMNDVRGQCHLAKNAQKPIRRFSDLVNDGTLTNEYQDRGVNV
jgi:hypothetical protein